MIKQEQNGRKIYLLFKTSGGRRATKCDKRGIPSTNDVKGMKEESGGIIKVGQF